MKNTMTAAALVALFSATSIASGVGDALAAWNVRSDLPGFVSMVWDGKAMQIDAVGYSELELKKPMTTNALFWAASNGKAIACALVLTYVAEGKIGLDDPVEKFLPEWKGIRVNGEAPKTKPTVRQLMEHKSGLPFFPKMPISQYPMRLLAQKAVDAGLSFHPGESYSYSNWGIDCAMAVCEVVGGETWDVLLKRRVLDPLGMVDATYFPDEAAMKRLVPSYRLGEDVPPKRMVIDQLRFPYDKPPVYAEAGGGLFCTAADMANFYRMLAAGGVAPDGRRFLPLSLMRQWYGEPTATYTFGASVAPGAGIIAHGGAYATQAAANWRAGTVRVFFTQCKGSTCDSKKRYDEWLAATDRYFKGGQQGAVVEGVRGERK